GAIADLADTVNEVNETNNARTGNPVSVVIGPDLSVAAISGPLVAGTPGTVLVTNTVENLGTGDPGIFTVGFYLSTDPWFTVNDRKIGSRTVFGLPPQSSDTATVSLPLGLDLPQGQYYLGAIADDVAAVNEANEANNAAVGNTLTVVTGPD